MINLQLMYAIANFIADIKKARGLVGYNTFSEINDLKNLKDFQKIIKYPIYRPLLGFKEDDLNELISKFDKKLFINRKEISIFDDTLEFKIFNNSENEIINEIAKNAVKNAVKLKI